MLEPNNTCPIIDKAIGISLKASEDLEEKLEEIRQANSDIREWGKGWQDKATELEEELDSSQAEVNSLELKVTDLREELKDSISQVTELEQRLEAEGVR